MIRTQISLEEATYRAARAQARREGVSFAEFCRRALDLLLASHRPPGAEDAERPWMRYAGSVASGDPDASRSVDAVVYGRRRP